MILICSPAGLRKRVGTVIPSDVERFVGAVGFNLPKVPLAANGSMSLEATMNEGFA